MRLVIDTREQRALTFPEVNGIEIVREALLAGDYGAVHETKTGYWVPDPTLFERKELGDLFKSFTQEYEREKEKWQRAQQAHYFYSLVIEGTVTDILNGHQYWKGGTVHESRKSGLAMLRQLCTVQRKYGVVVQFFQSRREMAWYILEYFRSQERIGIG